MPEHHRRSGPFSACCWCPGFRFSSAPFRFYAAANLPQAGLLLAPTPETFRQFLEQQRLFVFFVTVYVGAGLIANDRRANALQIYLSKPLTRAEYIARQAGDPDGLSRAGHLGAGDLSAGRADRLRRQLQLLRRATSILFPAITVFAFIQVAIASRGDAGAVVAVEEQPLRGDPLRGASCSSPRRSTACSRGDAQHALSWLSFAANLSQIGDVIFRLPLRYDTPWPVSLLMIALLIAALGRHLSSGACAASRWSRDVTAGHRRRRPSVEVVRPGHRPERRHGHRAVRDHRPARAERRRQVDVHEADHRSAASRARARSRCWASRSGAIPALYLRIGFCPEQDAFYERMTGLRVGDGAGPAQRGRRASRLAWPRARTRSTSS